MGHQNDPATEQNNGANTPPTPPGTAGEASAEAGWRKALAAERRRARKLERELKAAKRAQSKPASSTRRAQPPQVGQKGQRRDGGTGGPDRYESFVRRQLDARIRRVPQDRRRQVERAIDGLEPDRAVDVIDAMLAGGKQRSGRRRKVGPIDRGSPKGQPGPTVADIKKNPNLLKTLPAEKRVALLGQMGVQAGPRRVWG